MQTSGAKGMERAIRVLRDFADGKPDDDRSTMRDVRQAVDQTLDRIEIIENELVADRSMLVGYAENLADARRTITELEAELAATVAVAVGERERKERLESRVLELEPYEASAKAQLRALRRSIPKAARNRLTGHRGSGHGMPSS